MKCLNQMNSRKENKLRLEDMKTAETQTNRQINVLI